MRNADVELLNSHGLKATAQRLEILELFADKRIPLSAQEVAQRTDEGAVNQATVYRIIELFVKKGLLKEVHLRHDHIDYELVDGSDHHHIVCTSCGKIEDFEHSDADKFIKSALKNSEHFLVINEHAIELFGICTKCANTKHAKH